MPIWNLNHIHKQSEKVMLMRKIEKKVNDFVSIRKRLKKNIKKDEFLSILKKYEEINRLSSMLNSKSELLLCEDTSNSKYLAESASLSEILTHLGNKLLFFNLWFKSLPEKDAKRLIKISGKYRYLLVNYRKFKKYTLSEKEERIINIKDLTGAGSFNDLYDLITNKFSFYFKGKWHTQAELLKYIQSNKKEEREKAYKTLFEQYEIHSSELCEIYRNIVNDYRNEAVSIRGFSYPLHPKLMGDDIPREAYLALTKTVRKNSKIFQDYFKIKAKLIKVKNMSRYHIYAPYKRTTKKYSYNDSKKIVLETFKEFSSECYHLAKKIFDENHIHSVITKNKQSGAFCYAPSTKITPYILLNHVDRLEDVFTMAHELGHGIHALKANHHSEFTTHATLPICETASVFSEMLLSEKMLKKASKNEKISILANELDKQYATIIRQAYFTMFEVDAHDLIAQGATLEILDKAYLKNLKSQFGAAVKVPEVFKNEWKYIPHFYHTPFYCYAYAFGNLLVLALFNIYKKEGKKFVPKYMELLASGGSDSPENILKKLGIDIKKESFWQEGFNVIKAELDELKKLI